MQRRVAAARLVERSDRRDTEQAFGMMVLSSASRDEVGRGIALACAAVFVFSAVNALAKWQAASYPISEIVFFRSLFALIPVLFLGARDGLARTLKTSMPWAHLMRSLTWFVSVYCTFASYHLLPMADAAAISFSAPLFLTALSAIVLREHVGPHRWSAVAVGFLGVLVMVRPGAGVFQWGALFALGNAICFALGSLAVRQMASTERSSTIVFYTMLLATVLSGLTLPFLWVTPAPLDLAVIIAMGLLGGVGQLLIVQAFHHAPASAVAPWNYSAMIWAALLGWIFWTEMPDEALLVGAAIVIGSGLYLLHRETRLRRFPGRRRRPSANSGR
jgi:drug/metabolite transporter (DMT)-like permease